MSQDVSVAEVTARAARQRARQAEPGSSATSLRRSGAEVARPGRLLWTPLGERLQQDSARTYAVRIVSSFDEISRREWDDLVLCCEDATIFQSYDWCVAWWSCFARPRDSLLMLAAYDDWRLVGIAPLFLCHDGRAERPELRFVGGRHSDYHGFLSDDRCPGVIDALLDKVAAVSRYEAVLVEIPETSKLGQALCRRASHVTSRFRVHDRTVCPRVAIDERGRPISTLVRKKSLKRHAAALEKLGHVEVVHTSDYATIRAHLRPFFEQHIERRAVTPYPSLFEYPENRHFYDELASRLAKSESVLFSFILLDGKPVAYHYGLVSRNELIWYKPSFSIEHWKHAPGEVLLRELLTKARADGRSAFDFSRGDEAFKARFANEYPCNISVRVHATRRAALQARIVAAARRVSLRWPVQRAMRRGWDEVAAFTREIFAQPRARLLGRRAVLSAFALGPAARVAGEGIQAGDPNPAEGAIPTENAALANANAQVVRAGHVAGGAPPAASEVSLRELGITELVHAARGSDMGRARVSVAFERLRRKQTCYGLFRGDALIGWIWHGDSIECEDRVLRLKPDSAQGDCWYDFAVWSGEPDAELVAALCAAARSLHADAPLVCNDDSAGFDREVLRPLWRVEQWMLCGVGIGHRLRRIESC